MGNMENIRDEFLTRWEECQEASFVIGLARGLRVEQVLIDLTLSRIKVLECLENFTEVRYTFLEKLVEFSRVETGGMSVEGIILERDLFCNRASNASFFSEVAVTSSFASERLSRDHIVGGYFDYKELWKGDVLFSRHRKLWEKSSCFLDKEARLEDFGKLRDYYKEGAEKFKLENAKATLGAEIFLKSGISSGS